MIKISKEDMEVHLALFKKAQDAPAVLLYGQYDIAGDAWAEVRINGLKLAKKYKFEYEKFAIKGSGEVVPI